MSSELNRLNQIASNSKYAEGVLEFSTPFYFEVLRPYMKGNRLLEMGPAEGLVTEHLVSLGWDVTALEGSQRFASELTQKYPSISVVQSLFEDFRPDVPFDTILCGHVLEHVEDPSAVLSQMGEWLAPGGVVVAVVPNSQSIHRQMGVLMGLLEQEDSLNELDLSQGHRRVYSPERFMGLFNDCGFKLLEFGGYWLKSLSNAQIGSIYSREMLDASLELGRKYPEIAAEIFIVASQSTPS